MHEINFHCTVFSGSSSFQTVSAHCQPLKSNYLHTVLGNTNYRCMRAFSLCAGVVCKYRFHRDDARAWLYKAHIYGKF